ncbi:endo-1,4-beta-xylanase [Halopiger xanaduensis]|uniref:endo-1,4-beta-xylanase n=1 Tax=Halopiger xanaduensis (strain DSM 18323 / JCM 14033 / SH-6) TaxID=797210 RepID=F8DCC3_HALXS|nr:endo-1,4-beta-xylanase [Halopiger xanaduensis]AEH38380.1 Endo-1,4-beta-xylanase [Halopiger xanaduensis SH-6]
MATESTLRTVADSNEFRIGAALDPDALRVDPSYWKTAKNEFNAVTPENALKMGPLRPSRHTYDFADADAIVNFGVEHDMYVRGHTLVWHNQKPGWFQAWDYTPDQLRTFLRDHIHTVAGRYRAKIDAWDVVNEAVADDGSLRETVWSDALGEDYLADAFRWADEVTDADLYYNDYGADEVNQKSDAIYDLLEDLLADGVPIDGVGLQLHALGDHPDPESIAENIERFRDLGLDVQITEMDVAFHAGEAPADADEVQADYYREVVEACRDAGCDTLVTWGVHDGSSWLRSFKDFGERYTGDPLLFDDRYDEKPAYDAVKAALAER